MNPHPGPNKSLFSYQYNLGTRRTASTLIGKQVSPFAHKSSNSIGSAAACDGQLEQIKIEIKKRLEEQQRREEFLKKMLQIDNEPGNTELFTETTRKTEGKTSESVMNDSTNSVFCLKKIFLKCFWC